MYFAPILHKHELFSLRLILWLVSLHTIWAFKTSDKFVKRTWGVLLSLKYIFCFHLCYCTCFYQKALLLCKILLLWLSSACTWFHKSILKFSVLFCRQFSVTGLRQICSHSHMVHVSDCIEILSTLCYLCGSRLCFLFTRTFYPINFLSYVTSLCKFLHLGLSAVLHTYLWNADRCSFRIRSLTIANIQ